MFPLIAGDRPADERRAVGRHRRAWSAANTFISTTPSAPSSWPTRSTARRCFARRAGTGACASPSAAPATGPPCGVDDGQGDYLNCPMTREEYDRVLRRRSRPPSRPRCTTWTRRRFFEGCLPIEVMARRGRDTLRFGPMKPVGLTDPRTGRTPYAVVQLRQDTLAGDHFSLVGFQTQLKWGEQARVLRDDSRARAGRVRALRHGAPQHVHQRPDGAARDVADAVPRRPADGRPDVGRRRLRGVGGVGPDRRPQRRRAGARPRAAARRRAKRRSARWATTCRTPTRSTTSPPTSRSASCPRPIRPPAASALSKADRKAATSARALAALDAWLHARGGADVIGSRGRVRGLPGAQPQRLGPHRSPPTAATCCSTSTASARLRGRPRRAADAIGSRPDVGARVPGRAAQARAGARLGGAQAVVAARVRPLPAPRAARRVRARRAGRGAEARAADAGAPDRGRDGAAARDARRLDAARPSRPRDPGAVLRLGAPAERAGRPRPRGREPERADGAGDGEGAQGAPGAVQYRRPRARHARRGCKDRAGRSCAAAGDARCS